MTWYDNQMHWYKYLIGELDESQRYPTPEIALNVSLLTDGIFISSREGRFVTADEIKEKSCSLACGSRRRHGVSLIMRQRGKIV